ncbi:MAG: hypothetical protein MJE77_38480 [Proteobacteria bacterium]|nr:hypothetical protein [Pseudomonadota bacterium]
MLSALEDRASIGYAAQDDLLRTLVQMAQKRPDERLWQLILFYAFFPALLLVRTSTVSEEESGDLHGILWSSFLEILHVYPLERRSGSVAKGLLMDTKKQYCRILAQAHKAEVQRRRLCMDAYRLKGLRGGEYFTVAPMRRSK